MHAAISFSLSGRFLRAILCSRFVPALLVLVAFSITVFGSSTLEAEFCGILLGCTEKEPGVICEELVKEIVALTNLDRTKKQPSVICEELVKESVALTNLDQTEKEPGVICEELVKESVALTNLEALAAHLCGFHERLLRLSCSRLPTMAAVTTSTSAVCTIGAVCGSMSASKPIVGQKAHCGIRLRARQCVSRRSSPSLSMAVISAMATKVAVEDKIASLTTTISSLMLAEARLLTDKLQEVLGISAASFAPAGAGGAVAGASTEAAPVVEEQMEFDVILTEVPTSAQIAVIKAVGALTSLGLKEAKDLIEGLPKK